VGIDVTPVVDRTIPQPGNAAIGIHRIALGHEDHGPGQRLEGQAGAQVLDDEDDPWANRQSRDLVCRGADIAQTSDPGAQLGIEQAQAQQGRLTT